jgi:serine/threonine-protein kinase
MGKPTLRSDVFSLGLVVYRMFSGELPTYPFESPLPGFSRLRRTLSGEFLDLICKAIDPNPTKRFRDAVAMRNALGRIRHPLRESPSSKRTTPSSRKKSTRGRQAA